LSNDEAQIEKMKNLICKIKMRHDNKIFFIQVIPNTKNNCGNTQLFDDCLEEYTKPYKIKKISYNDCKLDHYLWEVK
jgi:hypothetical protein